ncbi:MAG: YvcK family protein [Clostridia bacterium]|nr:YvcK family protein [Clostridia bacterium]
MKSFLEWFKGSTKVKRWIFLILLGVALTCYSFAKILVTKEIAFSELWKIIILFVIGFFSITMGIVFIQRRMLELIIEANDDSEKGRKAKVNIQSLIFNKKVYEDGPKIVLIGGGPGLNTVIEGLKKYTNNITAIVTMSDYGMMSTSSGVELDSLPLEEIKDSIIAMSDHEELMKELMTHKFLNKRLNGLNFGDIYLTAMNEIYNNISEAIQKSTEVLNITGKVIPATLDKVKICAELNDGTVIEQKDKIPEIVSEKIETINRIFISPSNCKPAPGVLEAIADAEAIIIGPGSLYTNVIPNLLVKNVAKAVKDSKAIKLYVSNIMTEQGQTDSYSLSDHVKAIRSHVGTGVFDIVLADTGEVIPEYIRKYNQEGADIVEANITKTSSYGVRVIQRNMSCIKDNKVRHNSDLIASTIIELICNDLKFKDKQNETEYLLLNSVLKQQKKIQQKREKQDIKKNRNSNRIDKKEKKAHHSKSKFAIKYSERVKAIQNSDELILKKKNEIVEKNLPNLKNIDDMKKQKDRITATLEEIKNKYKK